MRAAARLLRHYGISLVATALALLFALLLWPVSQQLAFAFFVAGVMVSAWQGGPRHGLLATALSTLALAFVYYISPTEGADRQQVYVFRLGMFILVSFLANYLSQECKWASLAVDRVHATLSGIGEALLFTDMHGRLTFLNSHAQTLLGARSSETVHRPLEAIFQLMHEETRQPIAGLVAQVLQGGQPVPLPAGAVLVATSGKEVPIEGTAAPFRDGQDRIAGVLLTLRDVSARRQKERLLQQREEQIRKDCERQLHEQSVKQRLAEEAARQAHAEIERELEEQTAGRQQVEAALRQECAAWKDQVQEREAALAAVEQKLASVRAEFDRHLDEWAAAQEQHEAALRQLREEYEAKLGDRDAGQRRSEAALAQARKEHEKQLAERAAAQEKAEKALRQAREDLARQVEAATAQHRQAEAALRRQVEDHAAGQQLAEEALQQAQATIQRLQAELAERVAGSAQHADQDRAVAELQELLAERERQLQELDTARQAAEGALRQAHADTERQRHEWEADRQAAEKARQQAQAEAERQHREWAAEQERMVAALQQQVSQRTRTEDELRRELERLRREYARLEELFRERERQLDEASQSRATDEGELVGVHAGAEVNGQAFTPWPRRPDESPDWLSYN